MPIANLTGIKSSFHIKLIILKHLRAQISHTLIQQIIVSHSKKEMNNLISLHRHKIAFKINSKLWLTQIQKPTKMLNFKQHYTAQKYILTMLWVATKKKNIYIYEQHYCSLVHGDLNLQQYLRHWHHDHKIHLYKRIYKSFTLMPQIHIRF